MYNEPDFTQQKGSLQELIEKEGHICNFYPKFHPELNSIEQYWGAAKYAYRSCPPSSKIDDMEKNMINALDGVPLLLIHRSVHPSKISSIPHDTPSLDTSFALQGSWMLLERGLQAHRRFGQTESIMVIERFRLEQLTRLKVTS